MTATVTTRPKVKPDPFPLIREELERTEAIFTQTLASYRTPFASLIEHLKHYRGKRLRPALMLLVAKAVGEVHEAHSTLAAAVEMIHTATLVHDDVLDEADVRRHVSTVNAAWGNKISILLGDMLFTHAFHLTSQVNRQACEWIGSATNRVCAGELRQVTEKGNLHLLEADYFAIIDGKTAALTEVACRLGAIHAGATEYVADKFANYGRSLGLAFQIADDVLDLTGVETKTGKTLGTDIEQQKLTLPMIHCLAQLGEVEAEQLREAIRNNDRPMIFAALQRTGSVEYAKHRADDLANRAREELNCVPTSAARAMLEELTRWSTRREA
jgi:octaprenyl-diphosphate synthase